ncbi:GGDEF domain-containing protein [Streptomyces sp. NBC_00400]|uniref:GGDEF domain-containing protein n=1 Tax=Streptomyces sp. NBC_00400 TaxID=2975737 RepID=UPI002E24C20D
MSQTLTMLAAVAPLAAGWSLHSRRLHRRIEAARRDPLTGLLTRDPFQARARKIAAAGAFAFVVIDLDGFKQINDTYGHAAGDVVIAASGQRLGEWSRSHSGAAGRLGGDEFAAVIRVSEARELRAAMNALTASLAAPVEFEEHLMWVGASAGVVQQHTGNRVADLSQLMRRADEVMYGAKQTGGGWMVGADNAAPAYRTVNGRRDGRRGTSADHSLEGGSL